MYFSIMVMIIINVMVNMINMMIIFKLAISIILARLEQ